MCAFAGRVRGDVASWAERRAKTLRIAAHARARSRRIAAPRGDYANTLAALTGLSAETALALALVKRAREFAIGLPGLAAWAIAERRRPVQPPG